MNKIWQALGSRPESLKWAESQIWEFLWDFTLQKENISLGPRLDDAIQRIITRLPEIPISDLTWFEHPVLQADESVPPQQLIVLQQPRSTTPSKIASFPR